jgi:ferredoxin/flavodoxin---NADP+ reductase
VDDERDITLIPIRKNAEGPRRRGDPGKLESCRVAENVEIAPRIFRISFARFFDFIPGQSIALSLGDIPPRFYSIASGNAEDTVEVLYDLVEDGLLTPKLAALAPGDDVLVSRPFGRFRDAEGPSCWVAAGTGIAPFVSMVRSGAGAEKTLVHGSRSIAGILNRELFASILGGRYFPCCSREIGQGVFKGRPTEWLTTHPFPHAPRYLLCGSSGMVVDVRDVIIGKGIPFSNVIAEIYF